MDLPKAELCGGPACAQPPPVWSWEHTAPGTAGTQALSGSQLFLIAPTPTKTKPNTDTKY